MLPVKGASEPCSQEWRRTGCASPISAATTPKSDCWYAQAAEAKADLTVMANDPLMTSEFWAITGSAGNGTLFTFMPNPAGNANAASAVAGLKASGLPGEGYTLYACAAVQAWAEAVNRSGSFNADRVASALRSRPIDRFDKRRDNSASGFLVYRWRDGHVERVKKY
jgi:branched-chain amino acid transport system substrate-binding protein